MEPEAAMPSTPEDSRLVTNNVKESVKRLSNVDTKFRKRVIITKCLCNPCPRFYTDTISESIIIECKNSSISMMKVSSSRLPYSYSTGDEPSISSYLPSYCNKCDADTPNQCRCSNNRNSNSRNYTAADSLIQQQQSGISEKCGYCKKSDQHSAVTEILLEVE